MTKFVESFATQQLLPPWKAKAARTWSFAFRLDEELIRGYLKKYFNGGYPDTAPYFYMPLPGPQFGLLSVCWFPNIGSTVRGPNSHPVSGGLDWDHIRHTEVYLAFPALRYAVTVDGLMTSPSLVWVQPVVYSDNDTIVFSSREIWGTDMFQATIVRDSSLAPDQLHLDLGTIAVKTFNPRSVDQLLALLHIRATDASDVGLPDILKANPDLQEFVNILGGSGLFAGDQLPPGVETSQYPEGVELNNLKQFRDCYNMGDAIYRGIVASQTSYTGVYDIVFYDASKVDIAFMWSDSLAELLETVLGVTRKDTLPGPPPEHAGHAQVSPDEMDWEMDRIEVKVEFAFSFKVLATIHTYGTET